LALWLLYSQVNNKLNKIIIIIIIIIIIPLYKELGNFVPETNHVSRVHSVAAIL